MAGKQFPRGFLWGVATASYQIEGAVAEDGRGESIWDRFSHTPGKTWEGDTGDTACDHYHRYAEDVGLMERMGISAYRFSIAWPRIFPAGRGQPNRKGLDFYQRLLDRLEAARLRPFATLYHWDLPQALQDRGGWANRDTARWFADYAAYVMERLRGRVEAWITHNEPWVVAYLGHVTGEHAPGLRDLRTGVQVTHHLLLSHGLAVQAFRELGIPGKIGITLNIQLVHPATDREEDRRAAHLADGVFNRWFLEPVFKGAYPEDVWELFRQFGVAPRVSDGDLAVIGRPVDFLGVNYYTRALVQYDPAATETFGVRILPGPGPKTAMGWEIYPQGLYEVLTGIHRVYGPRQIYITENGAAFPDRLEESGEAAARHTGQAGSLSGSRAGSASGFSADSPVVRDPERIEYLGRHFYQAWRAIQDGVPLAGYFVWSLLDNFEWAFGYSKRFGLIYVDYPTQRRIPKESASFYRRVAEENTIDDRFAGE